MTDTLPTVDTPESRPHLRIQKGRARRLRQGGPWLFSNEVEMTAEAKALPPGTLVTVVDAGDERLGVATFNPHSLICARLLDRDWRATVDTGLIKRRLAAAAALRDRLYGTPHYRLVHSEADGLPGLIVDRYGDVFSVQANTAGMDRLTPLVVEALTEAFAPSAVVLRNDTPARALETLPQEQTVALGAVEGPVALTENGVTYLADVTTGQKTGWFYDQRPNRAFVANLAKDRRCIDVYSYAGGFGLACAAAGAAEVTLVDRAERPLALAAEAAARNGFADRVKTTQAEAFGEMQRLAAAGERFGVVVCDPPAFAKSKRDQAQAAKGYRKMARLGAGLVEPGGVILCGSCSHHMPLDRFQEEVTRGLHQAGRDGRLLHTGFAGADHPVHPALPESAYLKTLTFQLD
ncbi:LSU m5C1962 methyltransferase RlmI [Caenispirillum salinarum AK4]|uniref:LSU m5C1962 methyltransferase RlmI n=1 Tax=Caenispirillum salinarum AK4 TaxID=1238182 RepID=K9HPZ7_9PROT|nr:class I SAM-dependent rRNA methyltransferase [Caenispirillum salinarum]EKV32363.1 LSU m5C1962 methyltransferase RlmI [Caenispirillum salinarum AK4]